MIKINETFKKLIPPLSTDEYTALETSIVKEGVRDALVTWNGYIIDGHNRYEIATRHGLTYNTISKEFASEDEVIIWMIDNQLARRNISDGIKYRLAVKKRDVLSSIGLKNMSVGGESFSPSEKKESLINQKEGLSLSDKPSLDQITVDDDPDHVDDIVSDVAIPEPQPKKVFTPHNTQKEIAKTLGWSTGKVAQADVVFRAETPIAKEIQQKVIDGDLTIKAAYTEIRAVEKKEEVRAIQQKEAEILSAIKVVPAFDFVHNKSILDCKDIIPSGIKLLLTDPPYGQAFISNRRVISEKDKGIANDGDLETALQLLDETLAIIYPKMQDDSFAFVFTSWRFEPQFREVFEKYFTIKNSLIWVKANHGSGDLTGSFAPKHERILFGVKGNPKLRYRIPDVLNGSDIVTSHPTSKPIDLLQELIKVTTVENDMVIDPFSGHGSTAIASIKMGRRVFASEIDSDNYGNIIRNLKNV